MLRALSLLSGCYNCVTGKIPVRPERIQVLVLVALGEKHALEP